MGVRGPAPKNPEMRQRRNKTATRAVLKVVKADMEPFALPEEKEWHPLTLEWWAVLWRSPMAPEYIEMDKFALLRLAHLVDAAHRKPGDLKLEAEIARQEQRFGLTPLDRRRLQWEIEKGEEAEEKRQRREAARGKAGKASGSVLRALK